ncbi:SBBP repeat-containing protein [Pelosinus fermentans]|uniref:DUF7948 domain-containing protein n=1 Tax=Pelosinus fermentans JBW45 TaxID=1192197 RepID=I9NJS0_9FIRM|nr:SBBP repeat-containing protein [Pelosinus fermentans]AJQ25637.1 hypothetical protein JBW_00285 [Pelosinus fermentans JBW45]
MSPILTKYPKSGLSAEQERHIFDSLTRQSQAFIPNVGQVATPAHFYTRGAGYGFYFTPAGVNMAFIESSAKQTKLDRYHRLFRPDEAQSETEQVKQGMALSLRFIGANPSANIEARKEEPGTVNFFIGNDPAKWRTDLHSYSEVVYPELWPNIDMVFHNTDGVLKYEFIIQPGANVSDIRLTYDGADNLSTDTEGNLIIHTPMGILTEQRPVSYQPDGEQQLPVTTEFALERLPDGILVFGFTAGSDYDPQSPLIIDPDLVYSTYLGGGEFNHSVGIAIDTSGNAYVTGPTSSPDFPTTPGAFQTSLKGPRDVFITKLNPTGSALVYSTYLGGLNSDESFAIAVDTTGNAYVTGFTDSLDFPTTPGAFHPSPQNTFSTFVTKLNSTGNALVYSTYLAGGGFFTTNVGTAIAVDTSGSAYITGRARSPEFPITPGAFQTSLKGLSDAFVSKLNPAGSALIYSTYLGGGSYDESLGIAVDTSGNAYVIGWTESTDFPTTPGAFQASLKGPRDGFITKLNPTGSTLVYSTYFGSDEPSDIAVDTSGNAYIIGTTDSADFFTTPGAFQTSLNGQSNAFITKLNPAGSALVFSTYLGGSISDSGSGIAVDTFGNVYATGTTVSPDFPLTPDAFQTSLNGSMNIFITKLNPTGSALLYSTYLGGSSFDESLGIAVDTSGNAYVTGTTSSPDFPTTPGAFQTSLNGSRDDFVAKLQTSQNESMRFLVNGTWGQLPFPN